jgi:hypothetical protein
MLNGIDVSYYQSVMDWQKAKAVGVQFAIIRAGSVGNITGLCYTDDQYRNNVANLALVDIPYAVYWFFRPNQSVTKQAEYFLNLAKDAALGDLDVDLWVDIEVAGEAAKVKAFIELLDRSGLSTGIYTNPNTALYLLTGDKAWMAEYPLWLADWTAPANPPKPWTEWAMWQYAVKPDGKDYGAQSASIDHDYAQDWMILPVTPPPPPTDLEARLMALENEYEAMTEFEDRTFQLASNLDKRVTALDSRTSALEGRAQAAPISAPFKMQARTPARCITGYNDAGKPLFQIYPRDTSETADRIYLEGVVQVFPYPMTGDGGRKAYPVYKQAPVQLYVFADDGELQA